jgi:hypothetical protein
MFIGIELVGTLIGLVGTVQLSLTFLGIFFLFGLGPLLAGSFPQLLGPGLSGPFFHPCTDLTELLQATLFPLQGFG